MNIKIFVYDIILILWCYFGSFDRMLCCVYVFLYLLFDGFVVFGGIFELFI